MCLNDPIVQALYDNKLNWSDVPENDSPLQLDNYKSYLSSKNAWLKRPNILPKTISTQTENKLETLQYLYGFVIHAMLDSIPEYQPPSLSIPSITIQPKTPSIPNHSTKTLYIRNISKDTTELDLRNIFQKYGPIEHISFPKIMDSKHPQYGMRRGFALIQYKSKESSSKAFIKENTFILHGKKYTLEFAKEDR
jgi:hypothetical protein